MPGIGLSSDDKIRATMLHNAVNLMEPPGSLSLPGGLPPDGSISKATVPAVILIFS